jgi:hypothetical protein
VGPTTTIRPTVERIVNPSEAERCLRTDVDVHPTGSRSWIRKNSVERGLDVDSSELLRVQLRRSQGIAPISIVSELTDAQILHFQLATVQEYERRHTHLVILLRYSWPYAWIYPCDTLENVVPRQDLRQDPCRTRAIGVPSTFRPNSLSTVIQNSDSMLTLVRRGGKSSLPVFRKSRLVRCLAFDTDENGGAWRGAIVNPSAGCPCRIATAGRADPGRNRAGGSPAEANVRSHVCVCSVDLFSFLLPLLDTDRQVL